MGTVLRTNYRLTGTSIGASGIQASALELSSLDLHIVYGSFNSTFNRSSIYKTSTNGLGKPMVLAVQNISTNISVPVYVGLCKVSGSIMMFHGRCPRTSGAVRRVGFSATSTDVDDSTHLIWSALIISR